MVSEPEREIAAAQRLWTTMGLLSNGRIFLFQAERLQRLQELDCADWCALKDVESL